jgi:hypothetical protein
MGRWFKTRTGCSPVRNPARSVILTIMADVEQVEVVVAHHERATLRVGDVFLKIDADQTRTDVEALALAPIPTPQVLWRKPPVLALAALPGTALGRLGDRRPCRLPDRRGHVLEDPVRPVSDIGSGARLESKMRLG